MTGSDVRAVLEERGGRYGTFTEQAGVTQAILGVLVPSPSWCLLHPDQAEALHMIAHKLARIVCGDPHYADSWVDVAGYATLVADRLQAEEVERG